MELFDVGPMIAILVLGFSAVIVTISIFYFIHSAPPTVITISSGPEGSVFQKNAAKYAKILERNGVKLKVLPSKGSLDNLEQLNNPNSKADVGFVQAGITNIGSENLVSLGSIAYQPLLIFYRSNKPIDVISEFSGKKLAIGSIGSGVRNIALAVLAANGIKEGDKTTLLDWDAEDAAKALMDKTIDAAFVMSESASTDILHKLLISREVHLFHFKQANAYSRKLDFLDILDLPEGSIDLGLNIPPHDVSLVGPMIELVAKKNLHPALSDLLLEAVTEVHNKVGVFQHRGEFPAAIEHNIHLSDDATRFYKSGKSLLYRYLPFWLASLVSRIIVVFLPILVVLVPAVRSIPALFRWRMQVKIRRRYRELLTLEQDFLQEEDPRKREEIRAHFDQIEHAVNRMRVRAAFADQFYGLRGHIDYVREIVERKA